MVNETDLRAALRCAVDHIEHMSAWLGKLNSGYSFESLGEDMPGIKSTLLSATPDPAPVDAGGVALSDNEARRLSREIGRQINNGPTSYAWQNANEQHVRGIVLLAAALAPLTPSGASVEAAWQELCERDDRTSPEEYPDMCLITQAELAEFMSRAATPSPSPASAPSPAGGVREALEQVILLRIKALETPPRSAKKDFAIEELGFILGRIAALSSPATPEPALAGGVRLPDEMTLAIKDALSIMFWSSGNLARAYRAVGFTIPTKAEEEQAFVLWRTLRFAVEHGDNWRKVASDELKALRAAIAPGQKEDGR